jgi:TPR repeat protein
MPDFTRPREPITIDSATTSARESTVEPSSTPDSVVVHATDGLVTGDEGASASALPPDGVERVPVSAEVTVEHSAHESMAEARTVELLQPGKRLSKPDPVTKSSSLAVTDTPRVRVVSPGVIVTHPPAHAPLVSESRLVLEPAKPENHEVVPGSMLKIGRGPVVAGQEPASSDDTIVVAPVAMVDTTVATEDEFDTLTEIAVAESVAIESMAQADNTAPNDPVTSVDVSGSASTADERMAMASPQTAEAVTSLPVPAASGSNSAVSSSAPGSKGIFGRIKGFFSRDSDPVSSVTSAVGGGIAAKSDASMAPDPKAPDDGAPSLVHIGPVPEAKLDPGGVASITAIDDGKRALAEGRFASAAELFTRLAEQGNAEAQAHLGYMYYTGEGVESSLGKAVEMYRRAAVQGNRDAQYNLAVAYAFGEGVAQDDAEAVIWYRRAAEQGSAIAQYSLGVSYALGEGLMRDDSEAIKWYRAAAEQGYAAAQYNLGYSYRSGHGIEADDIEALQWFEAAARNGHASAQYSVGYMYRSGRGVSRNLDEAVKWYRLAAAQGHPDARADLASLNPGGF